mmetsp:Transcript_69414/g.149700  ORF Transcript_69414/g.149700 Transcript_69414/m.149700 type:complete len:151 (+) Transcript_69414:573-1025(+)
MFEKITGFGLGGSTIALFGRVGGGIYTKAADMGADLVGKLGYDMEEDDPRNPSTIADLVGDNVGDIAGMGSDLFGSFAESCCAAFILTAASDTKNDFEFYLLPLTIYAMGILVSLVCSYLTLFITVKKSTLEYNLKIQLISSTIILCLVS